MPYGETIHSKRYVTNELLNPFVASTFGVPAGALSDRWLDVRWDPPACMLLTVTVASAGAPPESGVTVLIPHIFTPETERTTHYWFASCFDRSKNPDGAEKAHRHVEGLMRPFADEDLPMLEAQQKVIGDNEFWSLKPLLLPSDAAAVRARRILDELMKREAQA